MTPSSQTNESMPLTAPAELSTQTIREWRASIEEFFHRERPKLRNLILELEESLWASDDAPQSVPFPPPPPVETTPAAPGRSRQGEVSDDFAQKRRLDDLAKSIDLLLEERTRIEPSTKSVK